MVSSGAAVATACRGNSLRGNSLRGNSLALSQLRSVEPSCEALARGQGFVASWHELGSRPAVRIAPIDRVDSPGGSDGSLSGRASDRGANGADRASQRCGSCSCCSRSRRRRARVGCWSGPLAVRTRCPGHRSSLPLVGARRSASSPPSSSPSTSSRERGALGQLRRDPYVAALLFAAPDDRRRSAACSAGSSSLGARPAAVARTSCSFNLAMFGGRGRRRRVWCSARSSATTDRPSSRLAGCGLRRAARGATWSRPRIVTLAITRLQRMARASDGPAGAPRSAALVAFANTAVGIILVGSLWERVLPRACSSCVVACVLFVLYRAYTRLTERHKNLETLHDFTRSLGDASRSTSWRRRWPAGRGRSCAASTWRCCCRPSGTGCRPAGCSSATRTCSAPACRPAS